jgi:hypothetical protein
MELERFEHSSIQATKKHGLCIVQPRNREANFSGDVNSLEKYDISGYYSFTILLVF